MPTATRMHTLGAYAHGHILLARTVHHFPREMWLFKPTPDQWSIHEILAHLADSEAHGYIRCRTCIAEPGQRVVAYDEQRWSVALHYHEQPVDELLALFTQLRRLTYQLFLLLPDSVWSQTLEHAAHGELSLDDWLDLYTQHLLQHIEQMNAVYARWQDR
jgi:hypothetical protein